MQVWLHSLAVYARGACMHTCAGKACLAGGMELGPCSAHSDENQPLTGPISGKTAAL